MTEVVDVVDEVDFDDLIATGDPVVVKLWATWCGPCARLAPHYEKAAGTAAVQSNMLGKTTFVSVDVDKSPWAMVRFGIQSVPTVKLFRDGGYAKDITGRSVVQILKELE